jgi:hypothetical protein
MEKFSSSSADETEEYLLPELIELYCFPPDSTVENLSSMPQSTVLPSRIRHLFQRFGGYRASFRTYWPS